MGWRPRDLTEYEERKKKTKKKKRKKIRCYSLLNSFEGIGEDWSLTAVDAINALGNGLPLNAPGKNISPHPSFATALQVVFFK